MGKTTKIISKTDPFTIMDCILMHNTFDVKITKDGFECKSHNFPECIGEGETEEKAICDMDSKIRYFADNYPKEFENNIRKRIESGLSCMCGEKLTDQVIAVKGRI